MPETEASAPLRWDAAKQVIILRDDARRGRVHISAIDPDGPHVSLLDVNGQVRACLRLQGPAGLPTLQFINEEGLPDGVVQTPGPMVQQMGELLEGSRRIDRQWRRVRLGLWSMPFAALLASLIALVRTF